MMQNPIISIVVPIYMVEQYLPRCIESLINQTYGNIEIILVDDGSPDKCGVICDEYAVKEKRITVVHKANGGLSDARNAGISIAKGDYLLFVDSDDWLEPDACESCLKVAKEHNADIVTFGVKQIWGKKKIILSKFGLKGEVPASDAIKGIIYQIHENGIFNYAWNKLYSKELFSEIRYPVGKVAEDQDTTYKLFHLAKSIWVCEKHLYNYVQRSGSISSVQYNSKLLKDRIEIWIKRYEFLKEHYPDIACYQLAQVLGDVYVAQILLKGIPEYYDFYNWIREFSRKHEIQVHEVVEFNKKVKLYFYCYPLFWLYVKLFIRL